jgi:hypothetical protein
MKLEGQTLLVQEHRNILPVYTVLLVANKFPTPPIVGIFDGKAEGGACSDPTGFHRQPLVISRQGCNPKPVLLPSPSSSPPSVQLFLRLLAVLA